MSFVSPGSASGNIEGLGKQNSMFPLGPVIKSLRLIEPENIIVYDLALYEFPIAGFGSRWGAQKLFS